MRVGIGYDIHRLVAGRRLVLGGVELPAEQGLLGHSDGDVLLHAVIDALLGAAALGDIGGRFPPNDARWQDAESGELLRLVATDLDVAGWRIENIDANVIAEQPRLAPHLAAMRGRLAELLGMPMENVSVKAKTNERLGPVGEGLAITATATTADTTTTAAAAIRIQRRDPGMTDTGERSAPRRTAAVSPRRREVAGSSRPGLCSESTPCR